MMHVDAFIDRTSPLQKFAIDAEREAVRYAVRRGRRARRCALVPMRSCLQNERIGNTMNPTDFSAKANEIRLALGLPSAQHHRMIRNALHAHWHTHNKPHEKSQFEAKSAEKLAADLGVTDAKHVEHLARELDAAKNHEAPHA